MPNFLLGAPHALFFNAAGDTLTSQTYKSLIPEIGNIFEGVAAPGGGFVSFSYSQDTVGGWFLSIYGFDSLGVLQWQKRHYTQQRIPNWGAPVALPDGFLMPMTLNHLAPSGTSYVPVAGVTKFDWQGNQLWDWRAEDGSEATSYNYYRNGTTVAIARDGTYATTYQSSARSPGSSGSIYDRDNRIVRFTADGDTLASGWFGEPDWFDAGYFTAPTADGGFLVCGSRAYRYAPLLNRLAEGYVFKLDSTLHVQWQKRLPPPVRNASTGSLLRHVQELANGHIRAIGSITLPVPGTPYFQGRGMVLELVPPTGSGQPGDTVQVASQWFTPSFAANVISQPDGSAIVDGYFTNSPQPNPNNENRYRGKWTGLGIPTSINLCATAPTLDAGAVSYAGPAGPNGNAYTFTLDGGRTHAGPRYGVVSLVRWTYSDGAPADTGFAVTRTFATPMPVRVTCTVTNNLGCAVSQEVYPFGACPCVLSGPTVVLVPAVTVFPNPSATGRFTLTGAGAATATVVDALGRIVRRATAVSSGLETLDLSAAPPGLYLLRLAWPDGRALTRKLVR